MNPGNPAFLTYGVGCLVGRLLGPAVLPRVSAVLAMVSAILSVAFGTPYASNFEPGSHVLRKISPGTQILKRRKV